jgi:hypothetical protein
MAQSVKFEAHFPAWFGPHRKHAARFEGSKTLFMDRAMVEPVPVGIALVRSRRPSTPP